MVAEKVRRRMVMLVIRILVFFWRRPCCVFFVRVMFEPHSGQVWAVSWWSEYLQFLQWRCVEMRLPMMLRMRVMMAMSEIAAAVV